jgi:hypothetical protein
VDFFLPGAVALSSTSGQGDVDEEDESAKSLDDLSIGALDIDDNENKDDEDAHSMLLCLSE